MNKKYVGLSYSRFCNVMSSMNIENLKGAWIEFTCGKKRILAKVEAVRPIAEGKFDAEIIPSHVSHEFGNYRVQG